MADSGISSHLDGCYLIKGDELYMQRENKKKVKSVDLGGDPDGTGLQSSLLGGKNIKTATLS